MGVSISSVDTHSAKVFNALHIHLRHVNHIECTFYHIQIDFTCVLPIHIFELAHAAFESRTGESTNQFINPSHTN